MPKADAAVACAVDAESLAMLEDDVKKGKPRKFALIYKGAQIKSLVVFKKGPYNTRIQAAKKSGFRGEAACGIVTGAGVNLTFQLPATKEVAKTMGANGAFPSAPTKVAKLKEFLGENGLKRKPSYQLIDDASELSSGAAVQSEQTKASPGRPEEKAKAMKGLERIQQKLRKIAEELNVQFR